jgi:hypothetical protein
MRTQNAPTRWGEFNLVFGMDLAMSRQPYLTLVDPNEGGTSLDFSMSALGERAEYELIIGQCVMAWPTIEIEMAMVLGHLLGTKDAATVAVFEQLRRSSAQRDAIMAAANIVLQDRDKELVSASLNAHKAIESERNAFAHGHFGTSSILPEGILWMASADYIQTKTAFTLQQKPPLTSILKKISVYRLKDLKEIFDDIDWLATHWYMVLQYLRIPERKIAERDQGYHARELEVLRRKDNPKTRPQ